MTDSLDFQIIREWARTTAQSKGSDPKQPGGGKPDLSVDDVQAAKSFLPYGQWLALEARICQSEIAERDLRQAVIKISWYLWRKNEANYKTRITTQRLDLVAEAATLFFLNPYLPPNKQHPKGRLRDEEWAAKFAETTDEKWARDFRKHYAKIITTLIDLYNRGTHTAKKVLKSAKRPETLDTT